MWGSLHGIWGWKQIYSHSSTVIYQGVPLLLLLVCNAAYRSQVWFAKGFPGGSVVKNLPVNAGDTGDRVRSPGQEDPLEEEMAIHSSILARKIPWTEESSRLQSMGLQRVGHDQACTCNLLNCDGIASSALRTEKTGKMAQPPWAIVYIHGVWKLSEINLPWLYSETQKDSTQYISTKSLKVLCGASQDH